MYGSTLMWPGDLVQLGNGRVGKIIKTNQANYRVIDESGGLWNVRIAGAKAAPEGATFNPITADEPRLGQPVRFTGAAARKFPGTYIVAEKNANTGKATFVRFNPAGERPDTDRGSIVKGGFASVETTTV